MSHHVTTFSLSFLICKVDHCAGPLRAYHHLGIGARCHGQLCWGIRPPHPLGLNLPAHSVDSPRMGACSPEYLEQMLSDGKCSGKETLEQFQGLHQW